MDEITVQAHIHKVTMDKDGESKITFTIPQSELGKVLGLTVLTGKILNLHITPDNS